MLVGEDVLVIGHNLETREAGNVKPGNPREPDADNGEGSDSDSTGENSFRVKRVIKVAELCTLSANQSTASIGSENQLQAH